MRCKLVIFHDGRRIVKEYDNHRDAAEPLRNLKRRGYKARLVICKPVPRFRYPPDDDDLSSRAEGKLWCPFCRSWSYFKVPKFKPGVHGPITDEAVFLNSCHRQGIKVCSWCYITEFDFDVRMGNGTFGEEKRRSRRKRRVA